MLTFCGSEENTCFKFIGANNNQNTSTNLISDNTSLISNCTSLISSSLSEGNVDSCSFYSGPSDATIAAFGESYESCGSIASSFSGGYSSGGSSFSGGCSYSC